MKINQLFSIKDKLVIISGCSSGIGLEIAKGFVENGARVIGISRSNPEQNIQFHDFFKCNINDEEKVEALASEMKQKKIHIDSLLNIAGVSIPNSTLNKEITRFDMTFNTNVRSMYNLINQFKPYFLSGSSIINFSSIGGKLGFPNNPSYCASKGAVISLSRALSNDLGPFNIRVNSIVPGYFHTKMTAMSYSNLKEKKIREERTMLGRWGKLNEILGAAIFLASDASSYITGSEITIDGGWSSKGL